MRVLNNIIKGVFIIPFLLSLNLLAGSIVDDLMNKNDLVTLKKLIDNTKIIDSENELPDDPKQGDLIIIDNEYEVKSLFEFHDKQWNDKVNKTISKLLENDTGTTYGNLFNYKINNKEFTPYVSDNFKYEKPSSKLFVKIITSKNDENSINKTIEQFLHKEIIGPNSIINIQFFDMDKDTCKIIVSYKN